MSRTVAAPDGFLLGDGSAAAVVGSARWNRSRWLVTVMGLVLVLLVTVTLARPATSSTPLSISNPGPTANQTFTAGFLQQTTGIISVRILEYRPGMGSCRQTPTTMPTNLSHLSGNLRRRFTRQHEIGRYHDIIIFQTTIPITGIKLCRRTPPELTIMYQ